MTCKPTYSTCVSNHASNEALDLTVSSNSERITLKSPFLRVCVLAGIGTSGRVRHQSREYGRLEVKRWRWRLNKAEYQASAPLIRHVHCTEYAEACSMTSPDSCSPLLARLQCKFNDCDSLPSAASLAFAAGFVTTAKGRVVQLL
jgi:hypothetical protein